MALLRNIVSISVKHKVVQNCRIKVSAPFSFTYTVPKVAVGWIEILLPFLEFVFLSAFAELRKATTSFVMSVHASVYLSVCPSFRPHGTARLLLHGCS
jgi:hypothetical protein